MSFYVSTANLFLLHCDEWDRVVALPRHKFVTGATLLQLTIGGPENSSWCLVDFILRGKQSKLLAVVSCLGVYILSFGRRYVSD